MTAPVPPPPAQRPAPEVALHNAVARYTASGYRTESMNPRSAVLAIGKPCNHVLHLLLTLVTCGLWAPIWIIVAVTARIHRVTVTVDDQSRVYFNEGTGWQ